MAIKDLQVKIRKDEEITSLNLSRMFRDLQDIIITLDERITVSETANTDHETRITALE